MLLPDNVNRPTNKRVNILTERGWEIKLMRKLGLTAGVTSGVVCAPVTLAPYTLQNLLTDARSRYGQTDGRTEGFRYCTLHVAQSSTHCL